jgi:hypothetical protein
VAFIHLVAQKLTVSQTKLRGFPNIKKKIEKVCFFGRISKNLPTRSKIAVRWFAATFTFNELMKSRTKQEFAQSSVFWGGKYPLRNGAFFSVEIELFHST